jgi:two-component system LytT family sensor kinase
MPEQTLVLLFVKLAVAASVASVLARSGWFQALLLREDRTLLERLQLAGAGALIFGSGVLVRVATRNTYQAVDLGFEGSVLLGLLGGYFTGLMGGVLISIPAMFNGELMSMPLFAAAGVVGALLRDVAPEKEDIWRLSPFFDLSLYRLLRKRDLAHTAFSILTLVTILVAEAVRLLVSSAFGDKGVFSLIPEWSSAGVWNLVAAWAATMFSILVPIRIWASYRNERILMQQQQLLNEARLAALSRQINPHFLFNTLNSVTSLIRLDPEKARAVVLKLSNILRRLLRQQENLCQFRDELAFIDDYLAIEMVRFGDKLRVKKEIDPETLDCLVPSMLLQPIVENSIRHGLASKIDGGIVRISSRMVGRKLHLLIEDDGVGIAEDRLAKVFESGIGVSNVNERLKVLYGDSYRMWMDSRPGGGTRTGIEIPDRQPLSSSGSPPAPPAAGSRSGRFAGAGAAV